MKKSILNEIRQVLFPDDVKCIVCGREMHPNRYGLCDRCVLDINENFCMRCGRHKVGIGDYCDECVEQVLYFDIARSAVSYDGNAKNWCVGLSMAMLDISLIQWRSICWIRCSLRIGGSIA